MPEMLSVSKSASELQIKSTEKPIGEFRVHRRFQSYLMPNINSTKSKKDDKLTR